MSPPPSIAPFHAQTGAATQRALAALWGLTILASGFGLILFIANHTPPGTKAVSLAFRFLVLAVTLTLGWVGYRFIRSRDPADDLAHPGLPDLLALWLLERYEALRAPPPVWADRLRTRDYLEADRRGFQALLTEEILKMEKPGPDPDQTDAVRTWTGPVGDLEMEGDWQANPLELPPQPVRRPAPPPRRRMLSAVHQSPSA
ncbi:MAG: hypothetical protein HQL82_07625 [Magnetococcales bacterium]|nr:hypothetical protein [Magnetococcales bacterium]